MRSLLVAVVVVGVLALAACGAPAREESKEFASASLDNTTRNTPTFKSLKEQCKLINDRHLDDPTANQTHYRSNVRGTDLGIPIAHGNNLFFFFGDTTGFKGIWPLGAESLPDAIGVAPLISGVGNSIPTGADSLCSQLRFLSGESGAGRGPSQDARIDRDFAPAEMNPPPNHPIGEFIHNPAGPRGANAFPTLPGDFEVPSGGFSYDGSIYLFYTTVESPTVVEMKGSYLVKWQSPSSTSAPKYDILYHVDDRFDAPEAPEATEATEGRGGLQGDFINIAPVVSGEYVYLFGTGDYRKSAVHLARKRLSTLATEGGFERYDAASKTWSAAAAGETTPRKPIVPSAGIGELSVRYFAELERYVMLDQEIVAGTNRIAARFALAPEGPWSSPVTVASMSSSAFRADYCCTTGDTCEGERMIHCDRAGFYGTYLLPTIHMNAGAAEFALDFTMSTWDPYNVALMTATFKQPQP